MLTYRQYLQKLYSINLHGGIKPGLANIDALCRVFGNPQNRFRSVHVAGTNGKGSVSTKIAFAHELQGLKVGLFTSPHIATFRERIKINGEIISEKSVVSLLDKIFSDAKEQVIPSTFFEITTLLAFLYFAESQVDIAIFETGLGGRLDSTNIILPELSVITSISLDHTEILGDTIEAITTEKAGIIKSGIPIVIGPKVPLHIIAAIAEAHQSHYQQILGPFPDFNSENNAIARCCLEYFNVPENFIQQGLFAMPPCRMESIPLTNLKPFERPHALIMDVAHNPDGLELLLSGMKHKYPNHGLRIICGLSKNKDIESCSKVLQKYGSSFHCISANSPRALSQEDLYLALQAVGVTKNNLFNHPSIEENLHLALQNAHLKNEVVIICGSFFFMAEIRKLLGFSEPQDAIELNELFSKK